LPSAAGAGILFQRKGIVMNQPVPSSTGFDLNRPTVVALLYLASFVVGITSLIGVILAFIWKGERPGDWTESHFTYLINTFWIGLAGGIVGVILTFILIGIPLLLAVAVLVIVRSIKSLLAAQNRQPMPNGGGGLI
jgi:uncharacterized membrane protein